VAAGVRFLSNSQHLRKEKRTFVLKVAEKAVNLQTKQQKAAL